MTTPLKLHAENHGSPGLPPLVVLHGMLGSGRNWTTMARRLGEAFSVRALDLRNHGASPHSPEMTYPAMAEDLGAYLDREGIEQAVLMGHSMGGKVAMRFAVREAQRVRSLVVVDIAPKAYPPRWEREFAVLRALDIASLTSRAEAEKRLEPDIPDWAFRKFLTTNLVRDPQSKAFRWAVNFDGLEAALPHLFQKGLDPGDRFDGPALFLRGGRSRFVQPDDIDGIHRHFPKARLECIEEAGHNVHFDAPDAFCARFLQWCRKEGLR